MIKVELKDHMGTDLKECRCCKEIKSLTDFAIRNDRSGRYRTYCKACANNIQRSRYEVYKRENPFLHKCTRARFRAKQLGVPFDLTPEYLESIWTGNCAAFNIPIKLDTDMSDETAAELDRFIPYLGYVIGNVHFLSRKANRIKNNVTSVELKNLLDWMCKVENESN